MFDTTLTRLEIKELKNLKDNLNRVLKNPHLDIEIERSCVDAYSLIDDLLNTLPDYEEELSG